MRLKDVMVRNAKPKPNSYKMFDGEGLYLEVLPSGAKYWRMKYFFAGKEKRLALGVYPQVTLGDAREHRAQARKLLAAGTDPAEAKREVKRLLMQKHENTFEVLAREWHSNRLGKWTPLHARKTLKRLESLVFPKLGHRPVAAITASEVLSVTVAAPRWLGSYCSVSVKVCSCTWRSHDVVRCGYTSAGK